MYSITRGLVGNTNFVANGFQFVRKLTQNTNIGFVFDVDGVLLRGSQPIPGAKEALESLNRHRVPFILLTNGGGLREKTRIDFISSRLGVPLSPLQIVQSHTPMKAFAVNNTYERVLVVGGSGENCRLCAYDYGFKDVVMPVDFVRANEYISPHHNYSVEQLEKDGRNIDLSKKIDAVLVFHDSRDATSDLQIVVDILNSDGGYTGTKRMYKSAEPAVPIVFSNNDLLWPNGYNLPRFGQGAFRIMVEALYREMNQLGPHEKLQSVIMGKPFTVQYQFAHHVLIDWRQKLLLGETDSHEQVLPPLHLEPNNSPFSKIYMVGDNPASDIKGANDHGWESLLLRTGVYRDDEGTKILPTAGIHDDVLAAVKSVLT